MKRRSSSRLGLQHSFPLGRCVQLSASQHREKVLTQAVLDQPMFESRWRWNATRSLVLERDFRTASRCRRRFCGCGLAICWPQAFPAAVACPENLPAGDLPIPMDHPLVRQTIDDCLTEVDRHRRADRGAQGAARWLDRARGGRHRRALGIRPRDFEFRALHVPRRCAAGRTPHAGGR